MADKEERILITKVSSNCHARRIACGPFGEEEDIFCDKNGQYVRITEKDCAKCKNPVLEGISRAEAVERMAKAMCQTSGRGCNECAVKNKPRNCKKILLFGGIVNKAEAALDALLGGKNG